MSLTPNPFVKRPTLWRRLVRRLRGWLHHDDGGTIVRVSNFGKKEPMNVAKDDASLNVARPFDADHED